MKPALNGRKNKEFGHTESAIVHDAVLESGKRCLYWDSLNFIWLMKMAFENFLLHFDGVLLV
jgi:hypothetical protein